MTANACHRQKISAPSPSLRSAVDGVTADLVLAVNEIYHDIEGGDYERKHPEIIRDTAARWSRIARLIFSEQKAPRRVLDIGSGTGFVPLQLRHSLRPQDLIVCSDLSAGMLDSCRQNLGRAGMCCHVEFVKLEGTGLQGATGPFDVITLNSVLHHVPDYLGLLREIDRNLRPGGALVIAHEPNRLFATKPFLVRITRAFLTSNGRPFRFIAKRVIRRFAAAKEAVAIARDAGIETQDIYGRVNVELIRRGLISQPLRPEQISGILDYHVQILDGDVRAERGFDVESLASQALQGYRIAFRETYNHLLVGDDRQTLMAQFTGFVLSMLFPRHGQTFSAVFIKDLST